jgi:hypothetical protein
MGQPKSRLKIMGMKPEQQNIEYPLGPIFYRISLDKTRYYCCQFCYDKGEQK